MSKDFRDKRIKYPLVLIVHNDTTMIKEEHTIDSLLLGPLTKPLMVIPTELISYVSWDEYGFNIENSFVRSNGLWYLDQVTLRRE